MDLRSHHGLVEPLGRLFFLGRSSAHLPARARVVRGAEFEAALKRLGRSKSPADRAARGRLLRLLGRYPEARLELDAALERADALAWSWELSTVEKAERPQDLAAALKLEPQNPGWLVWDAVRRGEAGPARRAAALAPKDAFPRLVEGLAELTARRPAEAEKALTAGLKLDPSVEWAYRARALARHDLGRKSDSLEDCFEAMRRGEMIGTLFIPLGLARRQITTRDNIEAATRELEKDPGAWWALVYRSDYRREPSINENAGALEDLHRALEMEPRRAWAWAYLARCQTAAGAFKKARESLEKAARLDPKCGWIRAWLGEHARRAGDTKKALADLEKAIALEPDYELAYAWRGGAKRAAGKTKEALADLDRAIALEPTYVEWCHFERMNALRDLGRIGDALDDLKAAHALNPKFVWENDQKKFSAALKALTKVPAKDPRRAFALAWRGEILMRMRDFPRAEKELTAAVKSDPKLAFARLLRGRARGESARWAEAMEDFEAAVELSGGKGVSLAWRGRAKLRAGDAPGACADLAAALGSRAEKAAAWIHSWKAEAELAAGRHAAAEASAGDALELHPRYAEARLWRGLARMDRGALSEALDDLRAAGAGDLTIEARAMLDAALAEADRQEMNNPAALAARLQREGRHDEAVKIYDALLAAKPKDAALLERRAEARRCLGLFTLMVEDWKALAALRPGDAGTLVRLGDARRHALDFHGALADARAALALEPNSAFARVLEAEALRSLGQYADAAGSASLAIAAAPDWTWAKVVRAKARRFGGDLKNAEADTLGTDHYEHGWRADIRRKAGRLEEALIDATKAVEAQPTIAWFRALRGEILRGLGKIEEGWAELEAAVRLDGGCSCAFDIIGADLPATRKDASLAWVYAWRGGVARKEGRLKEARADLELAASLDPKAPWIAAWLGELDLHEGRVPEALARLDFALKSHPGLRSARVARGRAAFALGKTAAARKDFETVLAADANDPWALIGSAACHEKEGRAKKALELFERARALAPSLFQEP